MKIGSKEDVNVGMAAVSAARAAGDVVQKAVLRCGPFKADCEKMI